MIARTALAMTLLIFCAYSAAASCSEPDAPYCATEYGRFDDEHEFANCKSEMETYQSEVEDYISCLKRKSTDAMGEYEDAVSSFNSRAGS
jgi:hypothetical protein